MFQPQIGDLDLLFYDGQIEGDVEHVKLLDEPYLLVAGAGTFPDGSVRVKRLDAPNRHSQPEPSTSPSKSRPGRADACTRHR
jgi:hypothetical protein